MLLLILIVHILLVWKGFQQKKNNIDIPKPEVIVNYNKYMGGVDQMDESIACYRTRMRQKK